MNIVIYSKKGCLPCEAIKDLFKDNDVEFEEKNITGNKENIHDFKEKGYKSVPVIESTGREPIKGYIPGELDDLIKKYKSK